MEEKEFNQDSTTETADFGINADENAAGTTHLNDAVEEESEIEKLNAELQDQKDKYLRLFAEFDNYKRRSSKERMELIQTKRLPWPILWGILDLFGRGGIDFG